MRTLESISLHLSDIARQQRTLGPQKLTPQRLSHIHAVRNDGHMRKTRAQLLAGHPLHTGHARLEAAGPGDDVAFLTTPR